MKSVLVLLLLLVSYSSTAQSLELHEKYSEFYKYSEGQEFSIILPFQFQYAGDTVIHLTYDHLWLLKEYFYAKGLNENAIIDLLFKSIFLDKPIQFNKKDNFINSIRYNIATNKECNEVLDNLDVKLYDISMNIKSIQEMYKRKDPELPCLIYLLFLENKKIAGISTSDGVVLTETFDVPDNIDPETGLLKE